MSRDPDHVRAPQAADWHLARGISATTAPELARLLGVPTDHVRKRLHAPATRGEWVMPVRGLWLPVPPEFRTWGALPGLEMIDAMMQHLAVPYYVGWLSAAEIHGAAHQAPQVFQVAVGRLVRDRTVGRTRFRFMQRPRIGELPTLAHPTRAGSARVATPELTALDVATDPALAGGMDNMATVLVELAEHPGLDPSALADLAVHFPAASGRRVGYVVEQLASTGELDPLHRAVAARSSAPSRLDPSGPASGPVNERWRVHLNRELEDES